MKKILPVVLLWASALAAFAARDGGQPDVLLPLANVPRVHGEFSRCFPLDWNSVARNWDYLIRYHYVDLRHNESASLFLVRQDKQMILASVDFTKVSFTAFDAMDGSQKLAAAAFTMEIDVDLAQSIYRAWVRALLCSQAAGARDSTSPTDIYLSADGMDTGYMCASAQMVTPGATTGRIVEIGRLLKQYIEAGASAKSGPLREQIIKQCGEVAQVKG